MSSVQILNQFVNFASKKLGLSKLPKIIYVRGKGTKDSSFGKITQDYDGHTIHVIISNRHPVDVMRTLAHELIHYKSYMIGGYSSQTYKEDEANALAGRIMRDYGTKYPGSFNLSSIKEEVAVNNTSQVVGAGDNPDPDKPLAKPLLKILKRKSPIPVKEGNGIFHKNPLSDGLGLYAKNKSSDGKFDNKSRTKYEDGRDRRNKVKPAFKGKKLSFS